MRTLTVALMMLSIPLSSQAAKVQVEVLKPAQIDISQRIQRVAVVDRSGARNAGQAILGTLEGMVTGEGIRADRRAAKDAVAELSALLRDSPRFEVVVLRANSKALRSSLWDKALTPDQVRDLCRNVCDGIVSLEAFDSDSRDASLAVDSKSAVASWRLYDARSGGAVDAQREHRVGYAPGIGDVVADMAIGNRVVAGIGQRAAMDYAARIAPTWQLEKRRLLGGSREIKAGRRRAMAGDWSGATDVWSRVARSGATEKIRGKARYNIAVALEAQGRMDQAIVAAGQSLDLLQDRKSRKLVSNLRMRSSDALRLEQQLAGRDAGPVASASAPSTRAAGAQNAGSKRAVPSRVR